MVHTLKTASQFFNDIVSGEKTFEVRYNDRDYKANDYLAMHEYDNGAYTGRFILVKVEYILSSEAYCKVGYVTMSISACAINNIKESSIYLRDEKRIPVYGGRKQGAE